MEFGRTPQDIEHNRRVFLIGFYAIVGALILIPLGVVSLVNGRALLGVVLVANSVFCTAFMIYSRLTARVRGVGYLFSVQAGLLAIFLVMHGGVGGTGIYFAYPLALMMLMLGFTGLYAGLFLGVAFIGIVAFGLYGPVPGVYDYNVIHKRRILMSLASFFMMSLISEWMRFRSYAAITNTTEKLSADAKHDPLTKLLNRRGLQEEVERLSGTDFPAVVAVIDIDHFKKINDQYGHDAGDVALRRVAEYLRSNMKGRDLICRWGGEEFVVIFRHTSLRNASKVLTQICDQARKGSIRYEASTFGITFSVGVVQMRDRDEFQSCLSEADELLYHAKENGRDRVVSVDMLEMEVGIGRAGK